MARSTRGRRLRATALTTAALAVLGATAEAAFVADPVSGGKVNSDLLSGIDPSQDGGVVSLTAGSLAAGKVPVPWAAFEQKAGSAQHIFVRAFKGGAWTTQGNPASLNIDPSVEAEHPSIDFAGKGRTVPWVAWYEPNSNLGGKKQIFASRFNSALFSPPGDNSWVPEGQNRVGTGPTAPRVPSLNVDTGQDAEDPALAGGTTVAGNDPTPWVTWQEGASGVPNNTQIFVSKAFKQPAATCGAGTLPTGPGGTISVSKFCWQLVGRVAAGGQANNEPTLNVDRSAGRNGVEPDIAFTGAGSTVPWVTWYEKDGPNPERVFAAKAVADAGALGGFHWQLFGPLGDAGTLPLASSCEPGCALNADPAHDAEDPAIAAGSLDPTKPSVPWIAWSEDIGGGVHAIFVARLVATPTPHFAIFGPNGGPISNISEDSSVPDIVFDGNIPYVSWDEKDSGGGTRVFSGHFVGATGQFVTDGIVSRSAHVDPAIQPSIASARASNPFVVPAAIGTPTLLWNEGTAPKSIFASSYDPSRVTTGAVTHLSATAVTLTGSLVPGGAAVRAQFQLSGRVTPAVNVAASTATTPEALRVIGLHQNTTYHYRLLGLTDIRQVFGALRSFRTPNARPVLSRVAVPTQLRLRRSHRHLQISFRVSEPVTVTVQIVQGRRVRQTIRLRIRVAGLIHRRLDISRAVHAGFANVKLVAADPQHARSGIAIRRIRFRR